MADGGSLIINAENRVLDKQYFGVNAQATAGRHVYITVTDTGIGMPNSIVNKIFEPFFTTKELHRGTGLGLSTVMAILKSHNGIIDVYSEPGKGTTFKVYLPAIEDSSGTRRKQVHPTAMPHGNGETILVVDDEIAILSITRLTLEAFGYRVFSARDGAEAVAIYAEKKNEIAVVLTDMMMPIMDGANLICALRRINSKIKIVAASGLSLDAGGNKPLASQDEYFLTKPYTAEVLLKTIHAILEDVQAADVS
jgi:CheY-like chemotaxis protein